MIIDTITIMDIIIIMVEEDKKIKKDLFNLKTCRIFVKENKNKKSFLKKHHIYNKQENNYHEKYNKFISPFFMFTISKHNGLFLLVT
jgi:hypothetical protein